MSASAASGMAALVLTQIGLGWYLGFSPKASLLFWFLGGLTVFPAWRLTRAAFPWTGTVDAVVQAAVITFAEIALIGLTLGTLGLLGMAPYLAIFAAASAIAVTLPSRAAADVSIPRVPMPIATIAVPMLAFIVAVGLVQSPLTLYDSVSYHLLFPARWLLDHRLSIVPTPFSDPAQAYQPANGELFFLWLMLPFHGDLLARIGQLPFLLLGAVSLYAIARRCGVRADHAAYAPLFLILTRPVVEQAVGADVDLVCAATFLTSIYLGLLAIETDARRDWMLWGVSLGLYLGSKYLALVYVVVLLALPLVRSVRWRALWALPGIAVFGLPCMVELVVAGSPIYPSSVRVFGFTIAHGAFTREAMNNSVFHVTSLRLLPAIAAHAFGAATLLFWLPCVVLAATTLLMRRRWWPAGYVLVVPFVMTSLSWFGIPDNADSRFLLPAVALAMVPLSFPFGSDSRRNAVLHVFYMAGAVWLLVGAQRQIAMSLPWFMGDWLALDGIVSRPWSPAFAAAMGATACIAYLVSRRPGLAKSVPTAAFSAVCLIFTLGAQSAYARDGSSLLTLSQTYIRAGMIVGWEWVHRHIDQATIANSGNNVPYPLFDQYLTNRVVYVNIDRHADWRFHDYARARRNENAPGALARPSGQLMPLAAPSTGDASRPRYERREGLREAWTQNLRAAGVTHLFVSVLSAYEIEYVRHNEGGFPIEDDWARADPDEFHLLYENDQVRVYAFSNR